MEFKSRTIDQIADMICGNLTGDKKLFDYRSSSYITKFFQDCDTDYAHDGTTRGAWVAQTLKKILAEPQTSINTPPDTFLRLISVLMDKADAHNEGSDRSGALSLLNASLTPLPRY